MLSRKHINDRDFLNENESTPKFWNLHAQGPRALYLKLSWQCILAVITCKYMSFMYTPTYCEIFLLVILQLLLLCLLDSLSVSYHPLPDYKF